MPLHLRTGPDCRRPVWVLLLVFTFMALAPNISAQSGVGIVPIAYHPFPDDADPLGVPYYSVGDRQWDYFVGTYSFHDQERDGFDFPSLVVDGSTLVEGTNGGTYESTLEAYREAFDARTALEPPLTMVVNSTGTGQDRTVAVTLDGPALSAEPDLALHWAIIEDDVYYKPPPALSNGVFIHRFTLRESSPYPHQTIAFGPGALTRTFDLRLDQTWDEGSLYLAVWVQNHAEESPRFDFGEVLQATLHPLAEDGQTVQERKGVLMEMFTATWCPACLFGDGALDTLASENGFVSTEYHEPSFRYLRGPQWTPLAVGGLVGVAIAAVVLRPEGTRIGRRRL